MEELIIVGAGAAGLFAGAVSATNNVNVLILEHTDNVGKKILSTGNGKCNMTNYNLKKENYYCENNNFIQDILDKFDYKKLIDLFHELGLITRDREGYVYPYSEQASSVREILIDACNRYGVKIKKNCNISNVKKENDIFIVESDIGTYKSKMLMLATGGKSFSKSGSDGSGYNIAKNLGHTVNRTVPALTSLICHEKHYKQISGVRAKCGLKLYLDDQLIAEDTGELQLTDYGISGIPVFNISRQAGYILKSGKKPYVVIDFMKEYEAKDIKTLFAKVKETFGGRTLPEQLSYFLNKKLALYFVKALGISEHQKLNQLTDRDIDALIEQIKNYKTYIANTKGFDFAQVTAGGVKVKEIKSSTMESNICDNLYFAGEIIDVDGRCGGYNLHFAWATAYIAAMAVADALE